MLLISYVLTMMSLHNRFQRGLQGAQLLLIDWKIHKNAIKPKPSKAILIDRWFDALYPHTRRGHYHKLWDSNLGGLAELDKKIIS